MPEGGVVALASQLDIPEGDSRKEILCETNYSKNLSKVSATPGAIKRAETQRSRVFTVETPDVKSIRAKFGVSKTEFPSLPGTSCCTGKKE